MEPDMRDEELPEPTGVRIDLNPDRVIAKLQQRAAVLVQNLQWDLATRDALVEVLQERLNESEQLREEAEGALNASSTNELEFARELAESRAQVSRLVRAEAEALEKIEELTLQLSEKDRPPSEAPAQRDAFLEAPLAVAENLEIAQTERLPAVSSSPRTQPASE